MVQHSVTMFKLSETFQICPLDGGSPWKGKQALLSSLEKAGTKSKACLASCCLYEWIYPTGSAVHCSFDFKETVKAFFTQKRKFYLKPDVFFLDCWQEKFADVGSLQKAIWVKIEVFWPSVDRKDISEYV